MDVLVIIAVWRSCCVETTLPSVGPRGVWLRLPHQGSLSLSLICRMEMYLRWSPVLDVSLLPSWAFCDAAPVVALRPRPLPLAGAMG